jgi:hypothetical protein
LADFLSDGNLTGTTEEELTALKNQFTFKKDEKTGEKYVEEADVRKYLEDKLGKENVTDE